VGCVWRTQGNKRRGRLVKHGVARLVAHGLGAMLVLPLLLLLVLSLARVWRYPTLWPDSWQFDQWRLLFAHGSVLLNAALRSLLLALAVALVATGAGFVTSRVLARSACSAPWLALALLPAAIPPVIYALSLGQVYAALGLSGSYAGVLLAQMPFAYAYAVLLCRGYWTHDTLALGALAHALGARPAQIAWRVHGPLARGLLAVCLFQTALISWFDFALVRFIGAGQVETLALRVFDYLGAGDLRQASAAALLLLAPPCTALLVNPRLLWPALAVRSAP
jgi:putative spermidine/putrescine transport system permease protein